MSLADDARRWIKDRTTSDEYITGTPQDKIRIVDKSLKELTVEERHRNIEHLWAYTNYYYRGHQKESVPPEVRQRLSQMSKDIETMNTVDIAREVMNKYGGAPSRYTVQESIERSEKSRGVGKEVGATLERVRPREKQQENTQHQGVEMGM